MSGVGAGKWRGGGGGEGGGSELEKNAREGWNAKTLIHEREGKRETHTQTD